MRFGQDRSALFFIIVYYIFKAKVAQSP